MLALLKCKMLIKITHTCTSLVKRHSTYMVTKKNIQKCVHSSSVLIVKHEQIKVFVL